MSCFIVSSETVRLLACAIEGTLNRYDRFVYFSIDPKPFEDCKTCGVYDAHKIYRKLYIENLKAWNERYKENVREFDRFISEYIEMNINDQLQLYKRGQCYLYQIAEQATYNSPVYKAIESFLASLAHRIAFYFADAAGVGWG